MSMPPRDQRERIRWSNQPTPPKAMHVPLLRPGIDRPLSVVAIGDAVQGCDLHHDGQHTIPCTGGPYHCAQCNQGRSWRRSWYLVVAMLPAMKLGILCITDGAYRGEPKLDEAWGSLRGHYIKAWRTGRAITGPMHVQVGKHCGSNQLPPTIDLREQLLRIWGYDPDKPEQQA